MSGSIHAPLLLIGSYPSNSTVHLEYAATEDVSNISINAALQKLGYDVSTQESPALSVLNWFPVRLIRGKEPSMKTTTPPVLREYWEKHTWRATRMFRAAVVFVMGRYGHDTYLRCLKRDSISFEKVFATNDASTLFAILENDAAGRVKRIALFVTHPESYQRWRSTKPTPKLRGIAMRERMWNLASIFTHDGPPRPAFLSSAAIFRQSFIPRFIPVDAFMAFAAGDAAPSVVNSPYYGSSTASSTAYVSSQGVAMN
jgi:hypothetical protein